MIENAVIKIGGGYLALRPEFFPTGKLKIRKLAKQILKAWEPEEACDAVTRLLEQRIEAEQDILASCGTWEVDRYKSAEKAVHQLQENLAFWHEQTAWRGHNGEN